MKTTKEQQDLVGAIARDVNKRSLGILLPIIAGLSGGGCLATGAQMIGLMLVFLTGVLAKKEDGVRKMITKKETHRYFQKLYTKREDTSIEFFIKVAHKDYERCSKGGWFCVINIMAMALTLFYIISYETLVDRPYLVVIVFSVWVGLTLLFTSLGQIQAALETQEIITNFFKKPGSPSETTEPTE